MNAPNDWLDEGIDDEFNDAMDDALADAIHDALEDEFNNPHLLAAEGYFELGLFEEAHAELDIADRVIELRMEVTARKLDIYLAQKNWADAAIYGEVLCDLDPDEPRYYFAYATALHRQGRMEKALAVLEDCPDDLAALIDDDGFLVKPRPFR